MASKEEVFNLTAHREVLRSFSLSDTKMSVEQNLQCVCTHHDSLMCQPVAAEDAPEIAQLLGAKHDSMEQIIEEGRPTGLKWLLSHKCSSRLWRGCRLKRGS